jgi:hypothetical protein
MFSCIYCSHTSDEGLLGSELMYSHISVPTFRRKPRILHSDHIDDESVLLISKTVRFHNPEDHSLNTNSSASQSCSWEILSSDEVFCRRQSVTASSSYDGSDMAARSVIRLLTRNKAPRTDAADKYSHNSPSSSMKILLDSGAVPKT